MRTSITRTALVIFGAALLGSPGSSYSKESTYKVGPGDILEIRVFGETEFTGAFRVSSDGSFEYPFLKKISASGKTTEEITRHLTSLLKNGYLSDPQVSVDVKDYKSQSVLVLGAVARPGPYSLQEETKIIDLISKAGGLLPSGGKRLLLLRVAKETEKEVKKEEAKPADTLKSETAKAEPAKTSPAATSSEKTEPVTNSPAAIVSEAMSNSGTKPIIIDYYKLAHEGDFSQNIVLQDGDILNVPKANEIFVLGNVAKPGPIPYEETMTILQAVTLAGGPTPMASTRSTYILRHGATGEERVNVRLDKILTNKAKNETLQADDVIVVPESFF